MILCHLQGKLYQSPFILLTRYFSICLHVFHLQTALGLWWELDHGGNMRCIVQWILGMLQNGIFYIQFKWSFSLGRRARFNLSDSFLLCPSASSFLIRGVSSWPAHLNLQNRGLRHSALICHSTSVYYPVPRPKWIQWKFLPTGGCDDKWRRVVNIEQGNETKMVEAALVKIASLTKVALGNAGMDILSVNLKGAEFNRTFGTLLL